MIPDPVQTPIEVVATLAALFLGQKGYAFAKQRFFADTTERLNALEERVSKVEKQVNPPIELFPK
jgi:hypothetical protein